MPISGEEFDRGKLNPKKEPPKELPSEEEIRVLQFLKGHEGQAFVQVEIEMGIMVPEGASLNWKQILALGALGALRVGASESRVLKKLVGDGTIAASTIEGLKYYKWRNPFIPRL